MNSYRCILPALLLVLSTGCAFDWSQAERGKAADDGGGEGDGDGEGEGDGDGDASLDSGESDGSVLGEPHKEPDPGCGSEGECGPNSSCDQSSHTCACDTNHRRVSGDCVFDPCADANAGLGCGIDQTCTMSSGAAACVCPDKQDACGQSCVDLKTDEANCGGCGERCEVGHLCFAGECKHPVHSLALGTSVSCALMETGGESYPIRCWGSADDAMFRDATTEAALQPRAVVDVPEVRAMSLTTKRRCVLLPNEDKVRCWGKCGIDCGVTSDVEGPTFRDFTVGGAIDITTSLGLSGAGGNTCARTSALVSCWGKADRITNAADGSAFIKIGGSAPSSFKALGGSEDYNCGVLSDGTVGCWGLNQAGQLGVSTTTTKTTTQGVRVLLEGGGNLSNIKSVSATYARACGVGTNGKLYCWGANAQGMLGHGDELTHVGAVEVLGISDVAEVALASNVSCARVASGQVYCWGYKDLLGLGADAVGNVGNGAFFDTPQRIPGLEHTIDLACSSGSCCSRIVGGAVKCWGANHAGQLGDGTKINRAAPVAVMGL